ncbi:hypothetical protein [Rhizobium leguminosarum]|uniref:hypothetical protein n=1 Tax=Rhizobium leguminosarum TaxID=384 RepID=UPI001C95630C|nr:hypothetical protein [Rhizobium leguminosarum]MBY5399594.1 hypothetical protein [Rhizobium leguminosarum]
MYRPSRASHYLHQAKRAKVEAIAAAPAHRPLWGTVFVYLWGCYSDAPAAEQA